MKEYTEVAGYPDLVRDPETNAILNINFEQIELAKAQKALRKKQKQELEQRLNTLELDIGEIKSALNVLINKL